MGYGKKVWIFPDAELPPVGVNCIPGHESVIITNTGDEDAHIKITLFYTDKEPVEDICVTVGAKRVRCLRTNGRHLPPASACAAWPFAWAWSRSAR